MSLRKQATSGMVWTFAEQFGNQIIGFVVSLILARLLLPAEFGLIGMISIFVGLGRVLVHSGLTQSLIRNEENDQDDYSTVFYFNLFGGFFVYGIAFFTAPLIANFYSQPILINIVRIYCLTFILTAFSAVQLARMSKNMEFKIQALITIPATISGGVVGVTMAYMDFGVYSLVWSQVTISVVNTIQVWFYTSWRPSLKFSVEKFKQHFGFGSRLAISGIVEVLFKNAYIIIIGKLFSPAQVGYYTRAETMKQLPVSNLSNALNKVTYPMFASIQNDNDRLRRIYKQLMQMITFILAPTLIFLAVLAEPTFTFLFTAKWIPAVPYFQILCFTGILYPIHTYNLNILNVKGRSDLFLKLKLYEKGLIVIGILIGLQFGIFGLLYAQILVSIIIFFINAHYADKFIDLSAKKQISAIFPILVLALFCGALITLLDYFLKSQLNITRILSGAILGSVAYLSLSWVFKMESLSLLKKLLRKKK